MAASSSSWHLSEISLGAVEVVAGPSFRCPRWLPSLLDTLDYADDTKVGVVSPFGCGVLHAILQLISPTKARQPTLQRPAGVRRVGGAC
jgi:hypothetical protein